MRTIILFLSFIISITQAASSSSETKPIDNNKKCPTLEELRKSHVLKRINNKKMLNKPLKKDVSVLIKTKEGDTIKFSHELLHNNKHEQNQKNTSTLLHTLSTPPRLIILDKASSFNNGASTSNAQNKTTTLHKSNSIPKPHTITALTLRSLLESYKKADGNNLKSKKFNTIDSNVDLVELFQFCCLYNLANEIQAHVAHKAFLKKELAASNQKSDQEFRCLALYIIHKQNKPIKCLEYAWKYKDLKYASYCIPNCTEGEVQELINKASRRSDWIEMAFTRAPKKSSAAYKKIQTHIWMKSPTNVIEKLYNYINPQERHKLLLAAIRRNELKIINSLLKKEINLNSEHTSFTQTPIIAALKKGNTKAKIIEALLKNGAKTNIHDQNGITPLHIAATGKSSQHVKLLLDYGASINAKTTTNKKPIDLAFDKGKTQHDIIHVLYLAQDKEINTPNINHQNSSSSSSTPF